MTLTEDSVKEDWRRIICQMYPDLLKRPYCVPPLHFNRVPYDVVQVGGKPVLMVKRPGEHLHEYPEQCSQQSPVGGKPRKRKDEADIVKPEHMQADFAQHHVLTNLRILAESEKEILFILSEFNFKSYLNVSEYNKATAKLSKIKIQGDFDIIIISRTKGILVGEIKSIGKEDDSVSNETLKDRIEQAAKQLLKEQQEASKVVGDIAPGLTVRATLMLPYITSERLHQFLDQDAKSLKDLCQCLEAASLSEAIELCVCSDQLTNRYTYWDSTPNVLYKLTTWWRHRMAKDDNLLTVPGGEQLYLDILARFVGPASTVSVHCPVPPRVQIRTRGQAVAELGKRLSRLVMTPQQLDLMTRNPPLAYICGPPGTGKTTLLVLQGLKWLRQGYDVHVMSANWKTLPVSLMITDQLQNSTDPQSPATSSTGTVFTHRYNFDESADDVDKAVQELTKSVKDARLNMIMDDVIFDDSLPEGKCLFRLLQRLLEDAAIQHFHLWSTGISDDSCPACLQKEMATVPLRCAPAVLREVTPGLYTLGDVHPYTRQGLPAPGDGPEPIHLLHTGNGHSGDGHTGVDPVDCETCGQIVAMTLRDLGVGPADGSLMSWCDVFVITDSYNLRDGTTDGQTPEACGLVRGLRGASVPVRVLLEEHLKDGKPECETLAKDVAVAQTEYVTVAHHRCLQGLERPIVVWLAQNKHSVSTIDQARVNMGRMYIASRCTTQLIIVDVSGEDDCFCLRVAQELRSSQLAYKTVVVDTAAFPSTNFTVSHCHCLPFPQHLQVMWIPTSRRPAPTHQVRYIIGRVRFAPLRVPQPKLVIERRWYRRKSTGGQDEHRARPVEERRRSRSAETYSRPKENRDSMALVVTTKSANSDAAAADDDDDYDDDNHDREKDDTGADGQRSAVSASGTDANQQGAR